MNWQQKLKHLQPQQLVYELEQLTILEQGYAQGYSVRDSLQCMSAFARHHPWSEVEVVMANGGDWQALLRCLAFRERTIQWFVNGGEWHDTTLAIQKTQRLLRFERDVRTQLGKTFAYPAVLLAILVCFALLFQVSLLPQMQQFVAVEQIWLFTIPKLLGGGGFAISLLWVSGWLWWRQAHFQQRQSVYRYVREWSYFRLWSCLRLALQYQLTLGQGSSLAAVFQVSKPTSFFAQRLDAMHTQLANGESLLCVMQHYGFSDETWLSFFQWEPTNAQILIASEFYWEHAFRQLQQAIDRGCQIGQTLVFLGIGVVLVQFYSCLFLPIFEIMNQF